MHNYLLGFVLLAAVGSVVCAVIGAAGAYMKYRHLSTFGDASNWNYLSSFNHDLYWLIASLILSVAAFALWSYRRTSKR
jgi:hypothetical protein